MLALALTSCLFIAAAQLWAANATRGRVAHSVDGVPAEAITLDYAGFDTFAAVRAHMTSSACAPRW